jgi:hypothetical protein
MRTTAIASPADTSTPFDLRRYAAAAVGAVVLNLVALWIGDAAGATLEIDAPEAINAPTVIAFTLAIMVVAGAGYRFLARRRPSIQHWAPWAGLAFAIVTAVMPFAPSPDTKTGVTLASMHLITGAAWLVGTRHR